jgi:nicotinate-nucleotide adenylyltransferase
MAQELVRQGFVDEMWLVVSTQNPLKESGLWDDEFRLELAREAVSNITAVEVSDVEFGLPKPNYIITTLETLSGSFPDREFVLVIGQDNWECFHLWYKWESILRRYRLLVLPRQTGTKCGDVCQYRHVGDVRFVKTPLVNISSTWVRSQISANPYYEGEGLDPNVWKMIKAKKQ